MRSPAGEARRQTEHVLTIHTHTARGLFQPDPAKVIEAENIIQNPFLLGRIIWFLKVFPPLYSFSWQKCEAGGGGGVEIEVRGFLPHILNSMGIEPHEHSMVLQS